MKNGMEKYPQTLLNVRVQAEVDLNLPQIRDAVSAAETQLGSRGRVLLRASGTEPLIRVMVEGEDQREVKQLSQQIADTVAAVRG